MPGDEAIQKIHEDMLERNSVDIAEIKNKLVGLATLDERFKNMEGWLKSIASDIKGFIEKSEHKYQTKEVCEMCMQASDKQYSELVKLYESRVSDLKETYTKAIDEIKQSHKEDMEKLKDEYKRENHSLRNRMWGALLLVISALSTIAWTLAKTYIIGVPK